MARILIIAGIVLLLAGLLWPWLSRLALGLGQLPGDIVFRRPGFTIYIPIVTSLLASAVLTLIFWFFRR